LPNYQKNLFVFIPRKSRERKTERKQRFEAVQLSALSLPPTPTPTLVTMALKMYMGAFLYGHT
jgi:hypothetical protein